MAAFNNPVFVMTLSTALLVGSVFPAAARSYDVRAVERATAYTSIALPAAAEQGGEVAVGAENFIDSMGKRATGFLGASNLSQTQKESEFRKLLKNSFDMATIGRFSLGRYWNTATEAQRKEYLKLFEDMVVEVYAHRFGEYNGQTLDVRSSRPEGKADTVVSSFIVDGKGSEFSVDWRVRYKDGKYKIVDVIIEGVSMSVTQRSDFSSVIQRGGGDVQVLLAHLKAE